MFVYNAKPSSQFAVVGYLGKFCITGNIGRVYYIFVNGDGHIIQYMCPSPENYNHTYIYIHDDVSGISNSIVHNHSKVYDRNNCTIIIIITRKRIIMSQRYT